VLVIVIGSQQSRSKSERLQRGLLEKSHTSVTNSRRNGAHGAIARVAQAAPAEQFGTRYERLALETTARERGPVVAAG